MRELPFDTAATVMVFMADSADHVTGKESLTLTITASKNGGAFASITPTVTERGHGWYALAFADTDIDTFGEFVLHITATGADPTDVKLEVIAWPKDGTAGIPSNVTQWLSENAQGDDGYPRVRIKIGTASGEMSLSDGIADANMARVLGNDLDGTFATNFVNVFSGSAAFKVPANVLEINGTDNVVEKLSELFLGLGCTITAAGANPILTLTGGADAPAIVLLGGEGSPPQPAVRATGGLSLGAPGAAAVELIGGNGGSGAQNGPGLLVMTGAGGGAMTQYPIVLTDVAGSADYVRAVVGEIETNAISAAAVSAAAVTKIQSGLSTLTAAQANAEVDTALADINLDHLMKVAAVAGDVVDNSVIARLASKSATPAFSSFNNTTDSLEAIRDRGDAAWAASAGGGTGARTVTVTVNDGSDPLQNAVVRMTEGANTFTATTNGSGVATFNLDDATYTVGVSKAGFSFAGTTLVVDGNETPTYSMTAIVITPPDDPAQATGYLTSRDAQGDALGDVTFHFELVRGPGTVGHSYDGAEFTSSSDAEGLLQVTLLRGATYQVTREAATHAVDVYVPTDQSTFALPELLERPG